MAQNWAQSLGFGRLEQQYGLPSGLLESVMRTESAGNPMARSPAGAQGLFQFMPATAQELGVDPFNPAQAAQGAARYLSQLSQRFGGDIPRTLAAYDWGMGNVERQGLENAPRETREYIRRVSSGLQDEWAGFSPAEGGTDEWAGFIPVSDTKPAPKPAKKEKYSATESAGRGVAYGLTLGFAPKLESMVTGEPEERVRKKYEEAQAEDPWAYGIGEVGSYIVLYAGGAKLVAKGGQAIAKAAPRVGEALSSTIGSQIGAGALTEGTKAIAEGKGGKEAAEEAATGAVLGGVGGAISRSLARGTKASLTGLDPSTDAQVLQKAGIQLTPGQATGSRLIRGVEEKATSVPVVGDMIGSARENATRQFHAKILEKALPPDVAASRSLGAVVKPRVNPANISVEFLDEAKAAWNKAYDDLYSDVVLADLRPIEKTLVGVLDKTLVTPAKKQALGASLDDMRALAAEYGRQNPGAQGIPGELISLMRGHFRDLSEGAWRQGDAQLGRAYSSMSESFDNIVRKHLPSNVDRKLFDTFRAQYRNWRAIEPQFRSAKDAMPTPASLKRAALSKKGTDDLKKLTDAGANVLPSRTPTSGTAERLVTGGALLGGGALTGMLPQLAAGALTAGAAYSRPGLRFLAGQYGWQQALRPRIAGIEQPLGLLGGATGAQLEQPK